MEVNMRKRIALLGLMLFGAILFTACASEDGSEWVKPEHFLTYDDPEGLYSISYPSDWKVDLATIRQTEDFVRDYISDIDEGIPVDQTTILFLAGIPTSTGYHPNAVVVIEPVPAGVVGVRTLMSTQINGLDAIAEDFKEVSRERLKIGGLDAYILEYKATLPGLPSIHALLMVTIKDDTIWSITCSAITDLDDFTAYKDDFHAIVRSLRIDK
jgi:hypothetical protein